MLSRNFIRYYSSATGATGGKPFPLLMDILPSKRAINKLLFDFDARLSYAKYIKTIEPIYENLQKAEPEEYTLPKKVAGSDLLLFQKILAEIRSRTHTSNKYLVKLEDELIEKSAEMGNRDALTILSFRALKDKENNEFTKEDQKAAQDFIDKLVELKHPLVFKMLADYQFNEGKHTEAISNYTKFLNFDKESLLASQVYQILGVIMFSQKLLRQSKVLFEKSIALAPVQKCAQSHFYLGVLNELDPIRARYHFELSSSSGFLESFKNLGFLELNYFKDVRKAECWFDLGCQVGDFDCFVGNFDILFSRKEYEKAWDIYDNFPGENKVKFARVRKEKLSKVEQIVSQLKQNQQADEASADRWSA
ncbi:unnamed protein product [Ambrosiozyma monospora]|uniref:Unnamed protein product n=1 Tax=Ambrosiozyma monospora TaxID=43982 RepID=A0ACB5T4H6_AMBMO|nr:unnamed protein product [Ambrosiozyma monospora]